MRTKSTAVFAIYRDGRALRKSIHALRKAGVPARMISVLIPENPGASDFPYLLKTQMKKGARWGVIIGFSTGLVLAFFAPLILSTASKDFALDTRTQLFSLLLGPLLGGAAGMTIGTLIGIGTPEPTVERYALYSRSGGILLSVHQTPKLHAKEIARLLLENGGEDINEDNEQEIWLELKKSWRKIEDHRQRHAEPDHDHELDHDRDKPLFLVAHEECSRDSHR